jgi:hypothetical protein
MRYFLIPTTTLVSQVSGWWNLQSLNDPVFSQGLNVRPEFDTNNLVSGFIPSSLEDNWALIPYYESGVMNTWQESFNIIVDEIRKAYDPPADDAWEPYLNEFDFEFLPNIRKFFKLNFKISSTPSTLVYSGQYCANPLLGIKSEEFVGPEILFKFEINCSQILSNKKCDLSRNELKKLASIEITEYKIPLACFRDLDTDPVLKEFIQ